MVNIYMLMKKKIYIYTKECYYVYVWALKNFQKLGTKGKKIIIIGDR